MKGPYTYMFTLSIGYVGANHEEEMFIEDLGYSKTEWDSLTQDERDNALDTEWQSWSSNYIEGGAFSAEDYEADSRGL